MDFNLKSLKLFDTLQPIQNWYEHMKQIRAIDSCYHFFVLLFLLRLFVRTVWMGREKKLKLTNIFCFILHSAIASGKTWQRVFSISHSLVWDLYLICGCDNASRKASRSIYGLEIAISDFFSPEFWQRCCKECLLKYFACRQWC